MPDIPRRGGVWPFRVSVCRRCLRLTLAPILRYRLETNVLEPAKRNLGLANGGPTLMRFRATSFFCLIWTLLLAGAGSFAQESPLTEYQIKSAFIFNFAK